MGSFDVVGHRANAPARTGRHESFAPSIRRYRIRHDIAAATASAGSSVRIQRPPQPTPSPIPLVGNLNRLTVDTCFLCADELHRELNSRIMLIQFLGEEAYYCRHPDDISAVLKQQDLYTKHPTLKKMERWIGDGLFSQTDEGSHAAQREALSPAFRMDYLRNLDTIFAASAAQLAQLLVECAQAGQLVELQALLKRMTLDSLGVTSFGFAFRALDKMLVKGQEQEQQQAGGAHVRSAPAAAGVDGSKAGTRDVVVLFQDILDVFLLLTMDLPVPDSWLPGHGKYVKAVEELEACIDQVLASRRQAAATAAEPGHQATTKQDLLGVLLKAQDAQGPAAISDKIIRDEIMTMMFAGSDTTAGTLSLLFHHLASHPEAAARAAAEAQAVLGGRRVEELTAEDAKNVPFINAAISETLRLTPVGVLLMRQAAEDTELGGYHVPAKMRMVLNIWSLHRHPDFWERPDEFVPHRWLPEGQAEGLGPQHPQAYLPFGTGARGCIGRNYALLQMAITAAGVLSHVRFEQCEKSGLQLKTTLTLESKSGVWLRPALMGQ